MSKTCCQITVLIDYDDEKKQYSIQDVLTGAPGEKGTSHPETRGSVLGTDTGSQIRIGTDPAEAADKGEAAAGWCCFLSNGILICYPGPC